MSDEIEKPEARVAPKIFDEDELGKGNLQESERAPRTWNGMPVYECAFCKFDSLEEAALEEHVKKAHLQEEVPVARTIVLTGRFGNVQEE